MVSRSHEPLDAVKVNVDAFMALSEIGLSSLERLTALNLNATRSALEQGVATAAKAPAKDIKSIPDLQSLIPGEAAKNAAAYLKSVQEIAAETQKDVIALMSSYFAQNKGAGIGAGWEKGFETFKGFGQQIVSMTEANRKAIGEATSQVAAAATAHGK
ncbi:MAG: phasin [Proteobacteria bacterium]|nr:phasin [Pseudomonadota bacterium]